MTASAIPAAKDAFLTICRAAITDTTVQFAYGHPGGNQGTDVVSVRDARSSLDWGSIGNQDKEEQLQLAFVISVRRGGTDQQAVTERAFALLDLIDDNIRQPVDASIGGTVLFGAIVEVQLQESNPVSYDMSKGRVAELYCTVTAEAIV